MGAYAPLSPLAGGGAPSPLAGGSATSLGDPQLAALAQQLQQQQQTAQLAAQQQLQQQMQAAIQQMQAQLQQQLAQQSGPSPSPHAPLPSPSSAAAFSPLALAQAVVATQRVELESFSAGTGNTAGIAAHNWLRDADAAFDEQSLLLGGAALPDAFRIAAARRALKGAAATWWHNTPVPQRPTTWPAFKTALLARYQLAGAEQRLEAELRAYVKAVATRRDKHTASSLDKYTAAFQERAQQISDRVLEPRARLLLFADGLNLRGRELAQKADTEALKKGVHADLPKLIGEVMQRAVDKEMAGGSASSSGDAMDLSSVQAMAHTFGLGDADARRYVAIAEAEGLQEYDTDDSPAPAHAASALEQARQTIANLEHSLAALSSSGPKRAAGNVPADLAKARRDLKICIKCGKQPYVEGRHGHKSTNCTGREDVTTWPSAAGAKGAQSKN